MQNIKNFSQYIPDSKQARKFIADFNVIYLKSEDGQDWYECQKSFNLDTIKVMYDFNNVIRSISGDISAFNPDGMSVAEVSNLPDSCDISGKWQYINGDIVPREYTKAELVAQAERHKEELLALASNNIAPLQDAIDLSEATAEEIERLKAWKKYRMQANRIDPTIAPDIEWPVRPV
ncbi:MULTISPECIES: tail fiber assembly protein [unclassified Photorhabdus]|uniref:tail fiber assembly protein n=1 Tax=unclassified Photorhabdus TaxID=2620880 RepID=UPI000DCB6D2C|nr:MULTISPECIES: tail fiber assembly protein [unclassified Photorhabdus]RAW93926.1 phage tail protein [Photorhabdus sp. S10-54]RAW95945.1 phage tail protein [Photorhabdus sp. S9-53]RAW97351.1 phage tail protein [Photorhabdus sp. S8-52]